MAMLVNQQARMTIGSQEYINHTQRIQQLRGVLAQHNQQIATTTSMWGRLNTSMTSMPGPLGAVVSGLVSTGKAMWALVANPIGATIASDARLAL